MRDQHIRMPALFDFLWRRTFEEPLQGFAQIVASLFDRRPLTGDIEFRTERHVHIVFAMNQGSQSA